MTLKSGWRFRGSSHTLNYNLSSRNTLHICSVQHLLGLLGTFNKTTFSKVLNYYANENRRCSEMPLHAVLQSVVSNIERVLLNFDSSGSASRSEWFFYMNEMRMRLRLWYLTLVEINCNRTIECTWRPSVYPFDMGFSMDDENLLSPLLQYGSTIDKWKLWREGHVFT